MFLSDPQLLVLYKVCCSVHALLRFYLLLSLLLKLGYRLLNLGLHNFLFKHLI